MGRGKIEKNQGKVEASFCPDCSYEHVLVPMFRNKEKDYYHCFLCKGRFLKRVNGKITWVEVEADVEFISDMQL